MAVTDDMQGPIWDQNDGRTSDEKTPSPNDDTTSDECKSSSSGTDDEYGYAFDDDDRKTSNCHLGRNERSTSDVDSFAADLMYMISSEANDSNSAVQWLPDGNGFIIRDQKKFEEQVLPRYFGPNCIFQSFVRRLYRYDLQQLCHFLISVTSMYSDLSWTSL